jgi:hypothetical protein
MLPTYCRHVSKQHAVTCWPGTPMDSFLCRVADMSANMSATRWPDRYMSVILTLVLTCRHLTLPATTRTAYGARAIALPPFYARTAFTFLSVLPFKRSVPFIRATARMPSVRAFSRQMRSILSALHKALLTLNPMNTGSCSVPSTVCSTAQDTGMTRSMQSYVPLGCAHHWRTQVCTQDLFRTNWILPVNLRPPLSLWDCMSLILSTSRRTPRWKPCSVAC